MYEVELKFRMTNERALRARATALGAEPVDAVGQCDLYFNHPQRDFAQTDEALRIRSVGAKNFVTYKGPRVDPHTKTRREIEVGVADSGAAAAALRELYERLGFRAVREVRKQRQTFSLGWQGREFLLAFDQVEGLGAFVEIETLSDEAGRPAAIEAVLTLAAALDLHEPEHRSYLSLLEGQGRRPPPTGGRPAGN